MKNFLKNRQRPGAIATLTILGIMAVVLIVMISVSSAATSNIQSSQADSSSGATFDAAEGGLQQALYGLSKDSNYVPTNPINVGTIPVTVTIDRASSPHTVTAKADGPNGLVRTMRIQYHASTFGGFAGAVQTGDGGFTIGNASVTGDVETSGSVDGTNNNAIIIGNITIGGISNHLNSTIVQGNVVAYTVQNFSKICGNASYHTIDSGNNSSFDFLNNPKNPQCLNPLTPGTSTVINSSPAVSAFPNPKLENFITVDLWNTVNSTPHIPSFSVPNGTRLPLGPKVIDGNLTLGTNGILDLSGPVWVKGSISFANGSKIEIDPSRGAVSDTFVSDGPMTLSNGVSLTGSGDPDSFLMVVSRSSSAIVPAISASNTANSVIFYAPFGTLQLAQNVNIKNGTAKKITMDNSASIVYDTKLADLLLTGGQPVTISIVQKSWSEL